MSEQRDDLRFIARQMLARARREGGVVVQQLSGGLFLALSLEQDDKYSLCLARDKAPGPSAREIQICRSAFEVPVTAEGRKFEKEYVIRWPAPARLQLARPQPRVVGVACGDHGCMPITIRTRQRCELDPTDPWIQLQVTLVREKTAAGQPAKADFYRAILVGLGLDWLLHTTPDRG